MPAIILPDKWRRQPSGPVSLDPQWSKNLLWCATPGSGGVDLTTGRLSVPAARSVTGGLGGLGYSYVTSGGGDTPTVNFSSSLSTNYVTQFTLFTMRSAVAWSACIYLRNGWHGLTFGPDGLDVRNVWAGIDWGTPTGLTLKVGKLHAAVQIITPTQKIAVVDGLVVTESQTNVEQAATLPTGWFGGDPGTTDRTLNGLIYLSGIVRDSWSIPQAIEWTRSPWQIFRKQSRVLYFDLGSGGGAITGSGTPAAQSATVAGTATRTITGLGTPSAQSATAAGTAEREITGSGAPVSQDATVSGTGSVSAGVSGSGVLSAQSATVAGTSTRTVTASGTPSAQSATVAGTAEREVTGSGTPTAQSATVVGTGQIGNIVTGSGAPAAQSATVAGTAEREITSSGAVSAQSSTVAGTGVRVITGTGSPNSTRRNGIRL